MASFKTGKDGENMEVTQAFEILLGQDDEGLGGWLKTDQKETGTTAVKFVKISENRGKLVYVLKSFGFHNPIDREQIKKVAIKKLYDKPSATLWKLSQQDLLYLVNLYEEIFADLINSENSRRKVQVAFRRVLKTLAGRNFDPNTLEFDLEKREPRQRSLAVTQIQRKLEEYRQSAGSGYLSSWVDELELSVRAYNLLKGHDIRTFGELVHVKDLLRAGKLKGLGRKTQLELQRLVGFIVEHSK